MDGRDVVAALSSFTPLASYFANGFFCFYFSRSLLHSALVAGNWKPGILLPWAELGFPVVLTRLFKCICKSAFIAGSAPDVQIKLPHSLWVIGLN